MSVQITDAREEGLWYVCEKAVAIKNANHERQLK